MRFRTKAPTAFKAAPTRRAGTAATEFVIVLPLMLLIGMGCLDIGRAVRYHSVMSNAASVGAHRAATNRFFTPYTKATWETKVRAAVRDELSTLKAVGAPPSAFDVRIEITEVPPRDEGTQRPALPRIAIAIDYDFQTTFRWPGFPRRIPLHCESAIREYR